MNQKKHQIVWARIRPGYLLFTLLLSTIMLVSWQIRPSSAAENDLAFPVVELPPEALSAPVLMGSEVMDFSLSQSKLDGSLKQLAIEATFSTNATEAYALDNDLRLGTDGVQTRVLTAPGAQDEAVKVIESAGGTVTFVSELDDELQAWIPVSQLEGVAADTAVAAINRPAYLVPLDNNAVDAYTEGFAPLNGQAWHDKGKRGAGVKVAIIDAGFLGYAGLLGSDLPSSVTAKNFVDGQNDNQVGTDSRHGTGCAEIVYDIAPDAQFFLIKIATNLDLQQAVNYAIAQGVDVISTSIGWYNLSPGDGTGQFANLVDLARNNGITWITAAGNDRDAHWGGAFADPDDDDFHNFSGSQEVLFFGPGNGNAYAIPPGVLLRIYVRWDDWVNINQDYALHVVGWNGSQWQVVGSSSRPQFGIPGQRPTEDVIGTTTASSRPYGFVIERISGSRNVNLEIFAPDIARLDKFVPERSLPNLADAANAITVGGIGFAAPFSFEDYSAQGPTNGPGGTEFGGDPKPNLAAYTGVSTEAYGFQAFSGTSASAPHAAGGAVLVRGAQPSYTPDQIQDFLEGRAIDLGQPGMDMMFGHGRLYLGTPPNSTVGLDNHVFMPVGFGN